MEGGGRGVFSLYKKDMQCIKNVYKKDTQCNIAQCNIDTMPCESPAPRDSSCQMLSPAITALGHGASIASANETYTRVR